jgi:hypothetical protein
MSGMVLHDRKMIIHMTDDISAAQNSSNALSLYGAEAEEHGLTLGYLVHFCRHNCRELLKDFEAAKGNQVLKSASVESKSKHGKKLIELVPLLATCRVTDEQEELNEINSMVDPNHHQMAMNPATFDIMPELMYRSIPLLQHYKQQHGKEPEITDDESSRGLAQYSLQVAAKLRFTGDSTDNLSA